MWMYSPLVVKIIILDDGWGVSPQRRTKETAGGLEPRAFASVTLRSLHTWPLARCCSTPVFPHAVILYLGSGSCAEQA